MRGVNMTPNELLFEVRELFQKRSDEVDRYFQFLSSIASFRATSLARTDAVGDGTELMILPDVISRELVKTLRANGYLLLYNLVESTMTNAVDAIHRCFEEEECDFGLLSGALKKIVLENFKHVIGHGSSEVLEATHPIQISVTKLGYNKEKLFSGNLDAREIRRTATRYGFTIAGHDTAVSRDGAGLKAIKDTRNSLAHGKISFEECGHDTSLDGLMAISAETKVYLDAVLRGIEQFVNERSYRETA